MIPPLLLLLAIAAFICAIVCAFTRLPVWVPVLLLAVIEIVTRV